MSELLTKISASYVKPTYTEVEVGDTVRVYTRIKEGEKERTQYFEGLVIRRRGGIGTSATFTVRRIASGVGVERNFPLHSPLIERVQIQRAAKVRRATLYTMRGLTGKAARLTERPIKREDRDLSHPWIAKYGISTASAGALQDDSSDDPAEPEQQTAPDTEEAATSQAADTPPPAAADVPEGDAGQDEAAAKAEKTKEEAADEIKDAPAKDIPEDDKADSVKQAEQAQTEADKADAQTTGSSAEPSKDTPNAKPKDAE